MSSLFLQRLEVVRHHFNTNVYYQADLKLIIHECHGELSTDLIKESLASIVDFSKKVKINYELNLLGGLEGTLTHLMSYLTKTYYPVLQKRGLHASVTVVPNNNFFKLAASRLNDNLKNHKVECFTEQEDAEKRLEQLILFEQQQGMSA